METSRSWTIRPQDCSAYILAGGRSSRFGSDKALVQVGDGEVLLNRLCSTLATLGHQTQVVADRADRYQQLGIRCLVDRVSGCGPLAGVAAALQHRCGSGEGWCLVLSCDQLLWRAEWFSVLAQHAADQVDAVGFSGRWEGTTRAALEPLPCLLHTRLLDKVLNQLASRKHALQAIFQISSSIGVRCSACPKQWSFNTQAELQELRARE